MRFLTRYGRRNLVLAALLSVFAGIVAVSCRHKVPVTGITASGYPVAVEKIIVSKCAISGCHNSASGSYAADLQLDTWDHMFDGGIGGAVVVPYNSYFSTLLHFVNTDSTLGHVSTPRMPANADPLSREEYLTLQDWILDGAPNDRGEIPFSSNAATRQKIYMTQQGCDQLAVVDAQRSVVMRLFTIGEVGSTEAPHCVRVSPDGRFAYVSFLAGKYIQKFDCTTDMRVASGQVSTDTTSQWNILHVSSDGQSLMAADFNKNKLVVLNTSDLTVQSTYTLPQVIDHPHGIAANPTFDTFYVAMQIGNVVFKFSGNGNFKKQISMDGAPPNYSIGPNPHEVMMVPDGSKYFVTGENMQSNKVIVVDAHSDTVIKTFTAGVKPQEIAMSRTHPYVFVTCMEDPRSDALKTKGSVYVYNYNTLQQVAVLYGDFYQPHAIAVDDQYGRLYVLSTNVDTGGPAPHHMSVCGKRNGWYSIYDLNTLQPYNGRKYETSVFPYSADSRFK